MKLISIIKKLSLLILITILSTSCENENNKNNQKEPKRLKTAISDSARENKTGGTPCDPESHFTNITYKDHKKWQFISASQSYNTMYGIYMKFKYNEKSKDIEGIELNLRNYKTNIPIGIYDVIVDDSKSPPVIDVYVQALNSARVREINVTIPSLDSNFLKINRILMPMFLVPEETITELSKDPLQKKQIYFTKKIKKYNRQPNEEDYSLLSATPTLNHVAKEKLIKSISSVRNNSNLTDIINNYSTLFDSEFFFKDGSDYIIPKRDYEDLDNDEGITPNSLLLADCRCKTSKVKIH